MKFQILTAHCGDISSQTSTFIATLYLKELLIRKRHVTSLSPGLIYTFYFCIPPSNLKLYHHIISYNVII